MAVMSMVSEDLLSNGKYINGFKYLLDGGDIEPGVNVAVAVESQTPADGLPMDSK